MAEAVKVMVRARPMNKRERSLNAEKVIEVREDRKEIMIFNPEEPENKKTFTYDNVFNENSQQKDVYEKSAYSIVENMFEGYNGTIFAYGQTGCGKTFSMMGVTSDEVLKGIIPRSFSHIIARIADAKNKNFLLRCSFIEIYNENIHDLLSSDTTKNMDLRESKKKGIFIKDLNMPVVKTVEEMLKWMNQGDKNRHVGATKMNQDSSRSHSIFTVYLEVEEKIDAKNSKIKAGKLNLVDLAGSERQSKTEATGQRLKEATKINLSLSALGNVIAALVSGKKKHIPYRDSKLTRLLQDSLGGNTKTLMIAAISPADDNYDETLGTLKYANRAKQIKNKPKVNEDPKDALIREYQEELKRLKAQLGAGGGDPGAEPQIARMNTEDKAKLETMQQMKGKLEKNNQDMMDQMNDQERLLNEEKKKRKEMEQRLAAMQAAMVMGGQVKGITKEEKDDLKAMEENAAIREMNEKNEGNSEEAQKKEKTDDMELMTDDVDEMQRKYEELQKRFKQVNRDVRDEEYENAKEKADILETLRFQERELDFLRQVATMVMSDREMGKIKQMAKWDDDEDDYLVPFFYFKEQNDIKNLPSISINNGGNSDYFKGSSIELV